MEKKLQPYEKEFIDKTRLVLEKFKSIKDNKDYLYDLKDVTGAEIFNFRSVGNHMVEHTEILNFIIVPIWTKNSEFFDETNNYTIARTQFENYYADRMQIKPANMWQTPLKLAFSYCTYDYQINSFGKLENYVNKFISYESALEKFQDYSREYQKLMKLVAEHKKEK
ncbi:hypothetical protein CEE75_13985 [Lactobacillus crispatus]|uniref:Uncharacterized protein n=1 Tax=Lactobacillus crispatus TaxID=47770 RepID=A0A4R6CQ48_9LACO|nr:hypothetical protein [Lactobacillus crispatus]TDN27423.1 hypothetical protein CEE75_13985 [Lactobacillus crispatus]